MAPISRTKNQIQANIIDTRAARPLYSIHYIF